jgi:hypothetical protein
VLICLHETAKCFNADFDVEKRWVLARMSVRASGDIELYVSKEKEPPYYDSDIMRAILKRFEGFMRLKKERNEVGRPFPQNGELRNGGKWMTR